MSLVNGRGMSRRLTTFVPFALTSKHPFLGLSSFTLTLRLASLRSFSSFAARVLKAPQDLHASISTSAPCPLLAAAAFAFAGAFASFFAGFATPPFGASFAAARDFGAIAQERPLLKGEIGGDSRKGGHGLRPSTLLFFEVASPINRRAIFNPLLKKFSDKRIHFLHPSFVARAQRLWFGLKSAIEAKTHAKYHDKPMSGLYAVLFSLTVCDEVDLYGFEAYTSKKTATAPYHYFDKVQGVTTVHSFDLALTIFKALGSAKPLRIK